MRATLVEQVKDFFGPAAPKQLGLAVSGGGDSVALMHLAHEFSQQTDIELRVITVDHGLRGASADEARQVGEMAQQLGLPHDIMNWVDWDRTGNLQNEARLARYKLMADWAASWGGDTIALGHTADDQAETMVMRLARRSGVDGLSGMPRRRSQYGISWVRPLLSARRTELRSYLEAKGVSWVEDPSNEDQSFDRIKARKALELLSDVGIDAEGLCVVAENLSMASVALNWQTFKTMRGIGQTVAGCVRIDACLLRLEPDEIQRRLLMRAIQWINSSAYVPRQGAMAHVLDAVSAGSCATVDGCQVLVWRGYVWVFREYQAVRDRVSKVGQLWDGRWHVAPSGKFLVPPDGLELRALGKDGMMQCPNWRNVGLPYACLMSSPAVWSGKTLVAAPVAGHRQTWYAEIQDGEESFFAALLTH